jgi:fermentation-respiration switch protein FrsA (DUF1100 family)
LPTQGGKPLPGLTAWTAKQILRFKTPLPLDQADVTAALTSFPGPMLLAQGSADRIVPIGPSQALAAARTAPTVTLWTGADHLGSYAEDPAAYQSQLCRLSREPARLGSRAFGALDLPHALRMASPARMARTACISGRTGH